MSLHRALKDPRFSQRQARWLYDRLQEFRAQAQAERKDYDTDSDVARSALARFEGLLQALTGDWS